MSVGLYYSLSRSTPFTDEERSALKSVMDRANAVGREDIEPLGFWQDTSDPEPTLTGSSKLLAEDPIETVRALRFLLENVTDMRRAVPDANWHVHLDDDDVPWDDATGYALPGLDDELLRAVEQELGGLPDPDHEETVPEPHGPKSRRSWFTRWRGR